MSVGAAIGLSVLPTLPAELWLAVFAGVALHAEKVWVDSAVSVERPLLPILWDLRLTWALRACLQGPGVRRRECRIAIELRMCVEWCCPWTEREAFG